MIRTIKVVVFLLCLVPVFLLAWRFFGVHPTDMTNWGVGLGPNPVEALEHGTGDWTLRFLLITLAITPLRKLLHLLALIKFRRMLGLFAFFTDVYTSRRICGSISTLMFMRSSRTSPSVSTSLWDFSRLCC